MLYICETGDNKQSMRARLFKFWAEETPQYWNFSVWTAQVMDEDNVENFATLIIRNDHPKIDEAAAEFARTAKLLNEKPDNGKQLGL